MKITTVCLCLLILIGCAAHRGPSTSSTPPPAITPWEQINYDNLQIAVHNRAATKVAVAAYQSGFIPKEYFDTLSKEGVNITKLHQQLTPLLVSLETAKANSDKVKAIINQLGQSAGTIAEIAGKGDDPTSKQALVSEAQIVQSLANSILVLLQGAGVITERRNHEPTDSGQACSTCRSPLRYYARGHRNDQDRGSPRPGRNDQHYQSSAADALHRPANTGRMDARAG